MSEEREAAVSVTFAGSGDAFGSGGRHQACVLVRSLKSPPLLIDCGATSLTALKRLGIDPGEIGTVFISHLHGDHFGGLPFLILDGQFSRRTDPLVIAGPAGLAQRLAEAMECLFPGSARVTRRFPIEVLTLEPARKVSVRAVAVEAWPADHPSGAPALSLRLEVDGRVVAYTGDTAWTEALVELSAGADLLIAESYFWEKQVPFHLLHRDLLNHRAHIMASRIVITHMATDMLAHIDQSPFEAAYDGMVIHM